MTSETNKSSETEEVKVLVLSHCILNRATRWWQEGKPIERNQGLTDQIPEFLSTHKIGAVQLPCPEFGFFGNPRPPATKDKYESIPEFRAHCENLAKDSAWHLKILVIGAKNPKIRILAVAGVERSPSCGVNCTPRKVNGKTRYLDEKGLFIEFLDSEMEKYGLKIPLMGLDMKRPGDFCRKLTNLLNKTSE